MGKHGRNNTASAVFTYHERRQAAAKGGYGTQSRRAGKDSIKDIDCCSLSMQPCRNPVVTPDGHLYDKEAILENIIHQKREFARQKKEYERQRTRLERENKELEEAAARDRIAAFEKQESSIVAKMGTHFKDSSAAAESEASRLLKQRPEPMKTAKGAADAPLPSFWVPGLTPEAAPTLAAKPDSKTRCPMSGKPLKVKDLVDVHFTVADSTSSQALVAREDRFMCPISRTVLRNNTRCVVLKPSGRVITEEAYTMLVKPDMVDPIDGTKLTESDIIPLVTGGTGFAGSAAGATLTKKVVTPAMALS